MPWTNTMLGLVCLDIVCSFLASVSLLRFAFPVYPLSYVPRAMHNLDPIGLARPEEPNHLHVHDSYLRQIQNKPRSVILELLVQFRDVLGLEVTTQADRGLSALRSLFDLHVPGTLPSIHASTQCMYCCMYCANADFTELTWFSGCERVLNCQES